MVETKKEVRDVKVLGRNEIIELLAGELGTSKHKTTEAVISLFDTITETVAHGGKVQINGFGSFEKRERAPRMGRNPQTGEEIKINGRHVPVFKPGKNFKDKVAAK